MRAHPPARGISMAAGGRRAAGERIETLHEPGQAVSPGAWSLEPGAWSLEPGAWSLEPVRS
jgi:hypothetical protein